jgi:hypothetical protein
MSSILSARGDDLDAAAGLVAGVPHRVHLPRGLVM